MNLFQQASTVISAAGSSAPINVPASIRRLEFNINATAEAGAGALTVFVEGLDDNGVWYPLYSPTAISTVTDVSQSIGPGLQTNTVIPDTVRVRWTITGTSVTCSMSLTGQPETA
jgi:hypothetical protein